MSTVARCYEASPFVNKTTDNAGDPVTTFTFNMKKCALSYWTSRFPARHGLGPDNISNV